MADRRTRVIKYFSPNLKKYSFHHVSVFFLTFFCYAFFHASRKVFPNTKPTIAEVWTPAHRVYNNGSTEEWRQISLKPRDEWETHDLCVDKDTTDDLLGTIDMAFMFSYAIGLFFSGIIGDRFEPRFVLSIGMTLSALTVFLWGFLLESLHYYNKYMYIALWALNGFVQSSGWPTVVAVMGNWFGKSSRGFILGLWSACASVGNIIGAALVASVLDYGYEFPFLVSSAVLLGGAVLMFFGLVPKPADVGLPEPEDFEEKAIVSDRVANECDAEDSDPLLAQPETPSVPPTHSKVYEDEEVPSAENSSLNFPAATVTRPVPISFFKAVFLPGVIPYSLCYAALKLVNYSFFFWLPLYLHDAYRWSNDTANGLSQWYDVGGIIGGTIGGYVSDVARKRSPVLFGLLLLAIPMLYIYQVYGSDEVSNAALMGLVGFFIGGAANIISAAICADMGRLDQLRGNSEALATVTGIVDGTGSVGAAIGQAVLPRISGTYGWKFVFYFFILCIILTCVSTFYMMTRELECLRRCFACRKSEHRERVLEPYQPPPTFDSSEIHIDSR